MVSDSYYLHCDSALSENPGRAPNRPPPEYASAPYIDPGHTHWSIYNFQFCIKNAWLE